jgi:hypothetical protein
MPAPTQDLSTLRLSVGATQKIKYVDFTLRIAGHDMNRGTPPIHATAHAADLRVRFVKILRAALTTIRVPSANKRQITSERYASTR